MRFVRQCNARCENGDYYYYDYEHDCDGDCDYGGECAGKVEICRKKKQMKTCQFAILGEMNIITNNSQITSCHSS